MSDKVEIISKEIVFDKAIFQVEEVRLKHKCFDGQMTAEMTRLNFMRGDSVGMLLHNTDDDTILLIEQFRYPAYSKGDGWLVEIPAGQIDNDEDPQTAAEREIQEEVGYTVQHMEQFNTFYVSPGGTSERIFLFYAQVTASDKTSSGGGLTSEGEDIRSLQLSVDDAFDKVKQGKIVDAKTIIALQWLQLRR